MPHSQKLTSGKKLSHSKKSKFNYSDRRLVPLFIGLALLGAVVVSVSVESRTGGWLRKAQPSEGSATAKAAVAPVSKANSKPLDAVLRAGLRPANPVAPTVTATKTDSLFTDVDNDGKADPGDTLKYTVTIGATGADATGVTFTDTVDPNTTFVAGTLMTTPIARPDSYTATGNVRIQVPAGSGVLANDSDPDGVGPAISATAGTFLSAQGGNVVLSADGSFTYNPPAGFEGTDTFTYTLNDNDTPNNTDTGTVSITVSGMIWFINNNVGSSGDGRLTSPFKTLADFQAVNDGTGNHPAANDNIFVYESSTDYVGPVTLLNGQKFIGQDATATLASIAGITLAPNSDALPATNSGNGTIVNITSAGAGINVGQNNTLRGFTGGNAAPDINGTSFGTLNVSDVTLNGNGQALNLSTGTLNGTFGSISSASSATTGISLTSVGGSLSTGSTTVTNPTGIGISVNTSSATLSFANTSVTGSGGTGVTLTSNTGTITFAALNITNTTSNQTGLNATGNSNTITTTSGTISTGTATAVNINGPVGKTPLNISLTNVSSSGGTASGIMIQNTSGSFAINGDGTDTTKGGNATGGTIANKDDGGSDNDPTVGTGVYLNNVSNITLLRMQLNDHKNYVIRGLGVTGFTLQYCTISGSNGDTNLGMEGDVEFGTSEPGGANGLLGSGLIDNCKISGSVENNLEFYLQSGTLNALTVSNCDIKSNSSSLGNDGILAEAQGSSSMTIDVDSCAFTDNKAFGVQMGVIDSATANYTINNNSVAKTTQGNEGFITYIGGNGQLTSHITNNTGSTLDGDYVTIDHEAANASSSSNLTGVISGNNFTSPSTSQNNSIIVFLSSTVGQTSTANVKVDSNTVVQNSIAGTVGGILVDTPDNNTTPSFSATVTNNNVTIGDHTNGIQGIRVQARRGTGCFRVSGNTTSGEPAGVAGLRVRQAGTATASLEQGASSGTAAVVLAANNPAATTEVIGTVTVVSNGTCSPAPSSPTTAANEFKSESRTTDDGNAPSSDRREDTLVAVLGQKPATSDLVKLSDVEVFWMAQAAIGRWEQAGLSAEDLARLQAVTFEVTDLPNGQLATAAGTSVKIDADAAGYGWFLDTTPSDDNEFEVPVPNKELQTIETSEAHGRMDLLTALMRELGLQISRDKSTFQGPAAWLMQGTLGTGTRRAPAFKVNKASSKMQSAPDPTAKQARTTTATEKPELSSQPVASLNTPRNSRLMKHHAMRPAMSLADVMLNIGTLPAGKTITITFNVQVKDPFPGPGATVCNQGTVSGTNFSSVLTDDPDVGGAADPTCTAIDLQADLAVTKTDSPDPVIAGNNLTYTINFVNNGPNASGATVTDATPAGTTFVSASVTTGTGWSTTNPSVGGTGNVVFSKASTANGETAVFQIVVHVNSSVAGGSTINNSATAATTGATDPVPGNNTGTASTSVIAQADLSITKTDGVTSKVPGTSDTYTIVVSNGGPSDANGVSVADTFPSDLTGVTFTSVAAGGATGNTAAGSGNISDTLNMPTGSSITYTVNATIKSSATGSLSNTATVTAPAGVTDPTPGNNSATDTDTLTPQADLSITKTDGVTTKVPGTTVTYTITVSNSGPSDAPGTTVADTFPATLTGVTFTSVAAGGATGNTAAGSGNINDTVSMPSGSSVTYTVNATVKSSATGSLSNTATVTAGAGVTDPTPGNNSATDTDTLTPQADLSITKTDGSATAVPGAPVTYTITVQNAGPSDAPGTTVSDTFPGTLSGVTFTSVVAGGATGNTAAGSGNISDTLSMPSGSSVTYTVNATVISSATGSLSNSATVTAAAGVTDPTPGNNSATDTDTLTPSADVAVSKSDSPDPVVVGNNITYTITVTNNGPSDAQSLSLSDAVPANTTLVSVTTPAGWTRTDAVPAGGTGTLTFTRPTQAATVSSIFTVVVNVNAGTANGTTITNTANVSSATTDPTPGNNSATATTLIQSNADLAISKTRSPNTASIDAGTNVTYTIQVANNGPAPASSVTFSDSVPAGLAVVSQSNPAGWSCNTLAVGGNGTITCTKATMANGETATLTVVATVSCNDANNSTITNSSSISAVSPPDNVPGNNTSGTSFTVNNPPVTVTASVAINQLPQNSHELINVGLAALASGGTTNCPPGALTVSVFGDEDDQTPTAPNEVFSPDAKDIAVGTLRLRAERVNSEDGRVYLIVVRSGPTAFATVTVVVPKSSSAANVASVNNQAATAKAYADSHNGAPPAGYFVIGDGPIIGNKQ